MFSINIFGHTLYEIIFWFWLYSFLGWSFECLYVAIHERRLVNRGFVVGPFCTIYGFGAIVMILSLQPFLDSLVAIFLVSMIIATTIELVVHFVLKTVFNQRWWDYSDLRFHYKGILSLESSIAWGLLSLFLIKILHPFVRKMMGIVSVDTGKIILITITIIYIIDHTLASLRAIKRSESSKMIILRVKTETVRSIIIDLLKKKKK